MVGDPIYFTNKFQSIFQEGKEQNLFLQGKGMNTNSSKICYSMRYLTKLSAPLSVSYPIVNIQEYFIQPLFTYDLPMAVSTQHWGKNRKCKVQHA